MSVQAPAIAGLRVFFAALPDPSALPPMVDAAAALAVKSPARLVPRSNLHMTLAFVGEVAASRVPMLEQLAGALRLPSFQLRFDAYEYWPKPQVVVAAARSVPPALQSVWQELHRELAARGLALEPKRLRPHVTLARKVAPDPEPRLPVIRPIDWQVREFHLMVSDTSGTQSAYTVLSTWPLLDNPSSD